MVEVVGGEVLSFCLTCGSYRVALLFLVVNACGGRSQSSQLRHDREVENKNLAIDKIKHT